MGGNRPRKSSKVVFKESRRFCSAALCEVFRTCMTGGGRRFGWPTLSGVVAAA